MENTSHKKLTDNIHLLVFNNQKEVAKTFVRFQEYYESPKFKGKIFSLDEFKDWYVKNSSNGQKTGRFTYYEDWSGFNIPSYVLEPFYKGKFDPLSKREKKLLQEFEEEENPFYIIGTHAKVNNFKAYIEHESAHGLFYTDEEYRKEINKELSKYDIGELEEKILSKGYHEDVVKDEIQAYLIESRGKFEDLTPEGLVKNLREKYNKYINKHGIGLK